MNVLKAEMGLITSLTGDKNKCCWLIRHFLDSDFLHTQIPLSDPCNYYTLKYLNV